jgi:hypothetical protein
MKPLNLDNKPCSPISSNCVIWQGPNLDCIKLCTGDTVSNVVATLATELCTILDELKVSNYDLSAFGLSSSSLNFEELVQFLIDKVSELNDINSGNGGSGSGSGSECPDCVVSVAPCLITGGQTTMQLLDYVQMIANRICTIISSTQDIDQEITIINSTLSDLQFQIDNLPGYTLPNIPVDCILSGNQRIDVVLNALMNDDTLGYCRLLSATGTPININTAVLSQCISDTAQPLAALPAVNTFSAYYSSSWVNASALNAAPTVSNAIKNIWVAICDIYNYSSDFPVTVVAQGSGITVTPTTVGNVTTYTVASSGSGSGVTLSDAGTTIHESLVNTGTGPALATKGLKAGSNISLSSTATDITITNTAPNVAQNLWATITATTGSTTANSTTDTLSVVGAGGITTSIAGDTLTITGSGGGGGGSFTYEIGQHVSSRGGVIAHRWLSTTSLGTPTSGTVENYLVVDTQDRPSATWGLDTTNVPNCESTWDGQANTTAMMTAGAAVGTAAQLCDSSTNNGFTDWYLPAIDELSKIFHNRWEIAQGLIAASGTQFDTTAYYWSSTEYVPTGAWSFYFNFGTVYSTGGKTNPYHVRAVRRFSIP